MVKKDLAHFAETIFEQMSEELQTLRHELTIIQTAKFRKKGFKAVEKYVLRQLKNKEKQIW